MNKMLTQDHGIMRHTCKMIGFAVLILAIVLLASCPPPTPEPAPVVGDPPHAPTGLMGNAGHKKIFLDWNAVTGSDGYNVYRGTSRIADNIFANSFTDTGLENDVSYDYTVRAVNEHGESDPTPTLSIVPRAPDGNFDDLDSLNNNPTGIWSDGTTMWVANQGGRSNANKLFAYNLESETRDADKDIDLVENHIFSTGIWGMGETIWVADNSADDEKLYAYSLAENNFGDNLPDMEFNLIANNSAPEGLWSNGVTIWVSDGNTDSIYAYTLRGGSPDVDKSLRDLPPNDSSPNNRFAGIWANTPADPAVNPTIWAASRDGFIPGQGPIYAYNLLTGVREESKEFAREDLTGSESRRFLRGIWSDGTTLWVVDAGVDRIYAYDLATKAAIP